MAKDFGAEADGGRAARRRQFAEAAREEKPDLALLCLLIVNFVPRRRTELLTVAFVAVVAFAGWWLYRVVQESRPRDNQSVEALSETFSVLVSRFSFAAW